MKDKQLSEFHTEIIKQVGLGINISRTYPKGHPSLAPVVQRLKLLLKEIPLEKEAISLVIMEDVIVIDDERVEAQRLPIVRSLVDRLKRLGVISVTFNVYVTDNDIKEFFSSMASTSADITDYGSIEALVKARGIAGIEVNKLKVGVVSSDEEGGGGGASTNWGLFLESLATGKASLSEEDRAKELGSFLSSLGITGKEPINVQSDKIVSGLEKLALMIAQQYGEDRWDEYSVVFARLLAVLSPNIKKNITKYRIENKKIATLFRELIPTMSDQDIVDIIATKAKDRSPNTEGEIISILKNVTSTRLPTLLSDLRVNVPELNFERIAAQLMQEVRTSAIRFGDKLSPKNIEVDMREFFPKLRDPSPDERLKALDGLMSFCPPLYEMKNYDLIRLLVDRFDSMADAETELRIFTKVIEAFKNLYLQSKELGLHDLVQFVSKKFGRHLMRKEVAFLERKNVIIKTITAVKDTNYLAELMSLLWDQGTFGEAREALISMAEEAVPLLIESLKDTEDRSVRMKIIDVLVRIGDRAVEELKKLLSSPEWFIRRNGVFILGEMKTPSAVNAVGQLVNDNDERVLTEVVICLGKIGGKEAKEYLREALESKYRGVVIEAMKLLEKDDVKHKLADIGRLLKSRKGRPEEEEQKNRCEIIGILGKVGDDSVVETLVAVLSESSFFRGELLQSTKEAALNALSQMGSPKALAALNDATKHRDHFVASTAQEILKRRETK